MKKIIAIYLAFLMIVLSVYPAYAVSISNVRAETTATTATIAWQTDSDIESALNYGRSESLGQTAESAAGRAHSVNIESLDEQATYYYRISAGIGEAAVYSPETGALTFTTPQQAEELISLESVPQKIPTNRIAIKGKTEPDAVIKIFRQAFQPYTIEETGASETRADSSGNFIATIILSPGSNNIIVTAANAENTKFSSKQISVEVDITGPDLRIEKPNDIISGLGVNLTGVVEEGSTVKYSIYRIINESHREPVKVNQSVELINNRFNITISLGTGQAEGNFLIVVVAEDDVGNKKIWQREVYADSKPPALVKQVDVPPKVNFFILEIKGQVSEKARVYVKNMLEETARTEYSEAAPGAVARGTVQQRGETTYYRVDVSLSPFGALVGYDNSFDTDADGNFDGRVALAEGPNNLEIVIVDKAGNAMKFYKSVSLDSGNSIWRIGRITTIPNFIYTDALRAGGTGTDVGLMYYLHYVGPDFPDMSCGTRCVDTRPVGGTAAQQLKITFRNQKSYFDKEKKELFVYVAMHFEPYGGDVYKLPDQLKLNLGAFITMNYGKLAGEQTVAADLRPVYFETTVAIEKPLKYSKWLTPKMINDTRKILKEVINPLKKVVDFAEKLSVYTLAVCAGYVAYSYFTAKPDYKTMYTICDRVQCPYVPPDCKKATRVWDLNGRKFGEDERELLNKPGTKLYRLESASSTDANAYTTAPPNDNKERYIEIEDQTPIYKYKDGTIITGDKANAVYYVTTEEERQAVVELDERGRCPRGYLAVRVTKQINPDPLDITFNREAGGNSIQTECEPITREQWNSFDVSNVAALQSYVGCYQSGEPAYDNLKCLDQSVRDTNPFEDIISSTRCGCFTGIRGNLNNLLQILEGMDKCLGQAYIGQVKGAYCERLIAQYACDLFITVIKEVTGSQSRLSLGGGRPVNVMGSYKELNKNLNERYGKGAFLGQSGLSSEQLVHKTCIAAVSADWSAFQDLVRATAKAPAEPIIGPLMPESRLGAYDPFTGELTINYLYTVGIMSGGQPVQYLVELDCVPGAPDGDACPTDRVARPIVRRGYVAPGGTISQNIMESVKGRGNYWYNQATLRVKYQLGDEMREKTFTEQIKHKDMLIPECNIDFTQHMIICEVMAPEGLGNVDIGKADISPKQAPARYYGDDIIALKMYLKTLGNPEDNFYVYWMLRKDGKMVTDSSSQQSESTEETTGIEKSTRVDIEKYRGDYSGRNQYITKLSGIGGTKKIVSGELSTEISWQPNKVLVIAAVLSTNTEKKFKEISQITINTNKEEITKCEKIGLILACPRPSAETNKITKISLTADSETTVNVYYLFEDKGESNAYRTNIKNKYVQKSDGINDFINKAGGNQFQLDVQQDIAAGLQPGNYDLIAGIYKDVDNNGVISEEERTISAAEGPQKVFTFSISYANQRPDYCGKKSEAEKNIPPKVEIAKPDFAIIGIEQVRGIIAADTTIFVNVLDDCNNVDVDYAKLVATGSERSSEFTGTLIPMAGAEGLTYEVKLDNKEQFNGYLKRYKRGDEIKLQVKAKDKDGKEGSSPEISAAYNAED